MTDGKKPEKRFDAGAVSASIWKNDTTNKKGEPVSFNTLNLQRRYQDKDGNWQNANSLRVNDIPKAVLVLNKAYEYLTLRDNESIDEVNIG